MSGVNHKKDKRVIRDKLKLKKRHKYTRISFHKKAWSTLSTCFKQMVNVGWQGKVFNTKQSIFLNQNFLLRQHIVSSLIKYRGNLKFPKFILLSHFYCTQHSCDSQKSFPSVLSVLWILSVYCSVCYFHVVYLVGLRYLYVKINMLFRYICYGRCLSKHCRNRENYLLSL